MHDPEMRKDCPMRGTLGNCSPVGGFCVDAVSDEICEAVHNAYQQGYGHAIIRLKEKGMLKEQEPVKVKDCADIVDGIQVGYCPKCDRKIVWNPEKEETVAFCKYCGKKVKWE